MIRLVKFTGKHEGTLLAKQLFFWDKKNKEKLVLVCAAHDTKIVSKEVAKRVGVKPDNLRMADSEPLEKYLGCRQGMVNYYSIVNDISNQVIVVMDQRLLSAPFASFHPMDNTGSTAISPDSIHKIASIMKRDDSNFIIMDFGEAAPATANAKPVPQKNKPKVEQGKKLTAEEKKELKT